MMHAATRKTCYTCKEEKPASAFAVDRYKKDGLKGACKTCDGRRRAKHKKDKPHLDSASAARRRAAKLQAAPKWSEEETNRVWTMLREAGDRLYKETGVKYHVDHIVPLQGKNVCGLHVYNNLQLIPETENLQKGNTFEPDLELL